MRQQFYFRTIEKKEGQEIELLRCFGETGEVRVPEKIDGKIVTAIGPYCFARTAHLPEKYEKAVLPDGYKKTVLPDGYKKTVLPDGKKLISTASESSMASESTTASESSAASEYEEAGSSGRKEVYLDEQAGDRVEKVFLPSGITKLDAYAFYNCRKLTGLSLPASVEIIGNDAFMNCIRLSDLYLNTASGQPSGLRQILAQITWNLEVHFTDACVFFPEYLEYYDEIGPAHVFEMQVEGEGFRIRKAFKEGLLQFAEYDEVFPKLSAEEPEKLSIRFAADRLLYPVELTEDHRQVFGTFLSAHEVQTVKQLFAGEKYPLTDRLGQLRALFEQKWLGSEAMEALMREASEKQIPEAAATFIRWKGEFFGSRKKKRYDFDDF